jgi:flagellar biosynthetic protein FliR
LGLLGVALFFALGAHRVALLAFVRGLEVAPLGAPLQAASFAQHALQFAASVSAALALALSIAAPAVLALILVELALGLLGRTAPQIPLHFAGMPLRAGLALGALLLSLSLWVPRLGELFGAAIGGAPR